MSLLLRLESILADPQGSALLERWAHLATTIGRDVRVELASGPIVVGTATGLTPQGRLVVDTGMGPANGARVLEHARTLAGDRPLILTLTHFHPEHGFGAQVFENEALIVYNAAQRDELAEKGDAYIGMFRGFGESVAAQLTDVRLVAPHVAYDGPSVDLDLGGRVVRLLTWGLAHTKGDQVVHLPAQVAVVDAEHRAHAPARERALQPVLPPHDRARSELHPSAPRPPPPSLPHLASTTKLTSPPRRNTAEIIRVSATVQA